MAIQGSYFENRINDKESVQTISPQPAQPSAGSINSDQVARNLRSAIGRAETEFYTKQAQRPAISYIPQVTAEFILGKSLPNWGLDTKENIKDIGRGLHAQLSGVSNEEYEAMTRTQQVTSDLLSGPRLAWRAAKGTARFVASLPKNIAKAPVYLASSAFNLTGRGLNKLTGTDIWDYPDKQTFPVLGEVRTAGLSYDEGRDLGMNPFFAAVKATGETASETLIALAPITDIFRTLTRPRNVVLKTTTGKSPLPLKGTATEVATKEGSILQVSSFKESKDILRIPIPNSVASQYKGNANNTFALLKPKGSGLAELSIVQQRQSLWNMGLDSARRVFGRKNVVPGEGGPLLKVRSEDIKYDPNFFNRSLSTGSALPVSSAQSTVGGIETAGQSAITQQALKYSSLDDFVQAQGTTIYRGSIKDGGSFSTSKSIADEFIKQRGGNLTEAVLSNNAKVANYFDFPSALYRGLDDYNIGALAASSKKSILDFMNQNLEKEYKAASAWAQENGFDAIKLPTEGEMRILNQGAVKTKEELATIWKQAQEGLTSSQDPSILQKALTAIETRGSLDATTASRVSTAQAFQFYSPNVEENLTFEDALARTESGNQVLFRKIGEDVDKQLGHTSQAFDATGVWTDGAENSVFNVIDKVNSYDELRYSTAIKGKIGKQKSVIPFMVEPGGADSLFITKINNITKADLRAKLDEFGLNYQTLVQDGKGVRAVIFDPGSGLSSNIAQLENHFKSDITKLQGRGEFMGSDVSREAGVAEFENIIRQYESAEGVTKYNPETFKVGEYSTTDKRLVDPFTRNRMARKDPNMIAQDKFQEPPSIMSKPLKGFEDKPITDKQANQVIGLAADLGLSEAVVQATAMTLTSKDNLYNLTQDELYRVSEIIRSFPTKELAKEPYDVSKFDSFFQLSRTWMSNVEILSENAGKIIPIDTEVRIPIETAIRLSRIFRDEWNQKFDEVLGGYTRNRHIEDRRLISSYVEGNKNSILQNEALSPQVKMELSRIGDWFIKYFQDSFKNKELGLTYSRWVGTYLPQIRKAGGINLLYKEKEIPAELTVFAQYERAGQLNVLEDDILVLAQIYNNAVAKVRFMKDPYEHAVKVIEAAPENIKHRTSDWLQEVMGRRDDLEKAFNKWGENLSKKTNGIVPKNISKQTLSLALSNMYAGALGLPRFMPIVRNLVGQAFVMPYAEFGPEYFRSFAKWVNKKGFAELKKRGFNVQSGVIYGSEVSETLGQGPIGKAVDYYKKLNQASMVSEGFPDLINRTATMGATLDRFENAYKLLEEGKIDYEGFLQEINFSGYSQTVRKKLDELLKKGTKDSVFQAKELAVKETIDALQFGYRKGSGAAFHHGLRGKALGQFTLFTWGYTTLLRDWVVRKQWDKLIRMLGMSANVKKSFEEELGIDASKWIGLGPVSVPISPMVRLGMLATEGAANAVGNMTSALNENYKEITRSLKLFLGVAGGMGKQRWEKLLSSVKEYEEGIPVYDPATGEKAFPLRAANGKLIRPISYGELLMYAMGFDTIEGVKQFDMLDQINKVENKKKLQEEEAMSAFVKGDFEKFNEIYVENSLYFNPADRLDSYQKGILQRVFERMDNNQKLKWYNIVAPIIYEQK